MISPQLPVRVNSDVSIMIDTGVTIKRATIFLVPTFAPQKFNDERNPDSGGSIYSELVTTQRAEIRGRSKNVAYVKIPYTDLLRGTYVILVSFDYGEGGCSASVNNAMGNITVY